MKYIIASLIAVGVWQCAVAGPVATGDAQPIAPVGECPAIDGEFPVLLPDSTNKSIFYICSHGRPVAMNCPNDLEFDPTQNTCVRPTTYSPLGECPPVDGDKPTFLPDSENATIYYECSNGIPIPNICPDGLVFNPKLNVCDWQVAMEKPRGECPEEDGDVITLLADEVSCSTYYVCFAGKPFMATCPEGLVFNPDMKYCDFPANVKCPEDKDDEEKDEDEEKKDEDDESL